MTPDAAGIEAALAAGLGEDHLIFNATNGAVTCTCNPLPWMTFEEYAAHVAAALLPVVTQAQAEALREVLAAIEADETGQPSEGLACTIELDVFDTPRAEIEELVDAVAEFIYGRGNEAGISACYGDSADPFAQGMRRAARIARAAAEQAQP